MDSIDWSSGTTQHATSLSGLTHFVIICYLSAVYGFGWYLVFCSSVCCHAGTSALCSLVVIWPKPFRVSSLLICFGLHVATFGLHGMGAPAVNGTGDDTGSKADYVV